MDDDPLRTCLHRLPVARILAFIERETGKPFACEPDGPGEAGRWHRALRHGLARRLHLNVGIPGVECPAHPVEENACALLAALLLGHEHMEIIISGEWEEAVRKGLLTKRELELKNKASTA
jgi:hypothetical protein